ncbi:MAG: mechanosensitive ion channel family protein [Burkholderiales bacterium]
MQQQFDIFMNSLNTFWTKLGTFVPQLLAALVLLIFGWIIAKLLRAGTRKFLRIMHFDRLAEKSGIEAFLKHGELEVSLTNLLSELVYWLVMLVVVILVSDSMGLSKVTELFNQVALYIPHIIIAIVVLVFGTLLARAINRMVFAYLKNIGVDSALTISTITEYAIQVFVVFVALEQLNIGTQLLTVAFAITFGALSLALALAFGLGGREWAAEILTRLTNKKK